MMCVLQENRAPQSQVWASISVSVELKTWCPGVGVSVRRMGLPGGGGEELVADWGGDAQPLFFGGMCRPGALMRLLPVGKRPDLGMLSRSVQHVGLGEMDPSLQPALWGAVPLF